MSIIYIDSYRLGSVLTTWNIGITIADTSFALITNSTCNFNVDWGDGQTDNNVSVSGTATTSHTYASSGSYVVKIKINSGNFYPYYNNNAQAAKIKSLEATPLGWSFGTTLSNAFLGAININTISPQLETSAITNFTNTWRNCTSLTSFPLINTSSGTNFTGTWLGCTSLTSFPLLNTSSGTTFSSTWNNCTSLTSFPLINTSSGTNFTGTWLGCTSLTSFPLLNTSSGTSFNQAWRNCSGLTTFPANFFDSWTATPANNCFVNTWDSCTSLTATSVENILNSINASGRSAPALGVDITISYNASSGTPNISTAVTSLKSRGWTITLNGVAL